MCVFGQGCMFVGTCISLSMCVVVGDMCIRVDMCRCILMFLNFMFSLWFYMYILNENICVANYPKVHPNGDGILFISNLPCVVQKA